MSKNTHLEHLEDELINNGYAGGLNAIKFLESLRDMLGTQVLGSHLYGTVHLLLYVVLIQRQDYSL